MFSGGFEFYEILKGTPKQSLIILGSSIIVSKIGSNTGSYIGSSIIGCSAGSIRSSIGSNIRIAKE